MEKIETESGIAYLQKTDVFRRLMYFTYKEKNVFHPLTVDKVNEIVAMNKNGVKPADLGNYAVKTPTRKSDTEEDLKYADTVGQTTLESLGGKKKKSRNRGRDRERRDGKNQPQHKTENRNQNQPQQKGKQQSQEQKQNQPQQKSPAKPQQKPKQNPQQNRTKPNRDNSGPTRPSVG